MAIYYFKNISSLSFTLLFFLKSNYVLYNEIGFFFFFEIGFNTESAKTILPSMGFWLLHNN